MERWKFCPYDGHSYRPADTVCSVCYRLRQPVSAEGRHGHGGVSSTSPASDAKPKWRKVLYEKQPYPDNYTNEETFLEALQTNLHVQPYDYWTLVHNSSAITQQLSTVALFVGIFFYVHEKVLDVRMLLLVNVFCAAFGFWLLWISRAGAETMGAWKRTAFFVCGLLGLSPVLKTLTRQYSSDTVWMLTVMLLLIHVFFHDYGSSTGKVQKITGTVAMNAAIFASVLLASRLPSTLHVFAIVALATQLFAMSPLMRRSLQVKSARTYFWVNILLFCTSFILLVSISTAVGVIFLSLVVFIAFISPYLIIRNQKYKHNISGPWDEAVPPTTGAREQQQ